MYIGPGAAREPLKEVVYELGLQVADQPRLYFRINDGCDPSTQVYGGKAEGFVHRHQEISGAHNALLIAERAVKGFAQRDAYVFNGVVLVYVEITLAEQLQIKCSVPREEFEHVVEKTNAGTDLVSPCALNREAQRNLRFRCFAIDFRCAFLFAHGSFMNTLPPQLSFREGWGAQAL